MGTVGGEGPHARRVDIEGADDADDINGREGVVRIIDVGTGQGAAGGECRIGLDEDLAVAANGSGIVGAVDRDRGSGDVAIAGVEPGDEGNRSIGGIRELRAVVVGNGTQHLLVIGDAIQTAQAEDAGAAVVAGDDAGAGGICGQRFQDSIELIGDGDVERGQVGGVAERGVGVGDQNGSGILGEAGVEVDTRAS